MTLLDISKLKNKDAETTTSAPQIKTEIKPQPKQEAKKSQPQTQNKEEDLSKIKEAVAEGLSSVSVDKKDAEKKYEEIQKMYDELSLRGKEEVYEECIKLFNALK